MKWGGSVESEMGGSVGCEIHPYFVSSKRPFSSGSVHSEITGSVGSELGGSVGCEIFKKHRMGDKRLLKPITPKSYWLLLHV